MILIGIAIAWIACAIVAAGGWYSRFFWQEFRGGYGFARNPRWERRVFYEALGWGMAGGPISVVTWLICRKSLEGWTLRRPNWEWIALQEMVIGDKR